MPSQAGTNRPPLTAVKYRLSIFNSRNKKLFQLVTNKVVPHVVVQAVVVITDVHTSPTHHWNLFVPESHAFFCHHSVLEVYMLFVVVEE